MKVNQIANFGKGLVEISIDPEYKKLKNQINKLFLKYLFKQIGIVNLVSLLWNANKEKRKMKNHDWSKIERNGFKKENLGFIIEDIAFMKALVKITGKEKACALFSDILEKINKNIVSGDSVQNTLMIPEKDMKLCDDEFIAFKEYIKTGEAAMEIEGFHKVDVMQDNEDTLDFKVKYCIAHEVAKEFGDSIYGFPWCQIDDIVLPIAGEHLGFKYSRLSTLCFGASMCDFRFDRI